MGECRWLKNLAIDFLSGGEGGDVPGAEVVDAPSPLVNCAKNTIITDCSQESSHLHSTLYSLDCVEYQHGTA
jgi:hypothetical protein